MNKLYLVAIDVREESLKLRAHLRSLNAFELSPQTYFVVSGDHPMSLKSSIERFLQVDDPPRDGILVLPLSEPRISMNFDRVTEWFEEQRL